MTDLNVGGEAPLEEQGNVEPKVIPTVKVEPIVGEAKPESVEETPALPRLEIAEHYDDEVKAIVTTLNHFMPNMDLQRAFGIALDSGDSHSIDRNYIREMVGDDSIADAIARTIGSVADAYGNTSDTAYQEVFDSVGGQEQWQGIATFFNTNATESEKAYASKMTRSKDPKEIKAGAEFVKAYAQRMGVVSKNPAKVSVGAGGLGSGGLSDQEYREKYREIRSTTWNSNRQEALRQIQELDQQRLVGKQLGR